MQIVGDKIPGLGADELAPKSRFGGRKSGSLVRFIGEGIEGTGERDALDEVGESGGESGGSMIRVLGSIIQLVVIKIDHQIPAHCYYVM